MIQTNTMIKGRPIVTVADWTVLEMVLDQAKVMHLWKLVQMHRTLFSDLTKGDYNNFVNALTTSATQWWEVWTADELVGIAWMTDMSQIVDATVHLAFFDRQPTEKAEVIKALISWVFSEYPMLHRLTATPPDMYHATKRLLERIGFKWEGRKRQCVLMGGKWHDQQWYGYLRPGSEEKE